MSVRENELMAGMLTQLKRIADALENMEPRNTYEAIKPMEPFNPNAILPKS